MRLSDGKEDGCDSGYEGKQGSTDRAVVKNVKFEASCDKAPLRLPLPQVAFCGRSNVGKSSLINALLKRRIAFVSKNPGKTALINLFLVNDRFYVVDLPGYGYAKRSKKMRSMWQKIIEDYLRNANLLRQVFVLVDSRHPPLKSDMEFMRWLDYYSRPFSVILTKVDKANQKQISETMRLIKSKFADIRIFQVSSLKNRGIDNLRDFMFEILEDISA